MSPKQLMHFRNILEGIKIRLGQDIDRTVHTMQDEATIFADPNDRASQESDMALELRSLHHHLENYTTRIIPALKKNYDVTMLAYEQNNAQLPEVIDAWEALNMAQMEYLNRLQELYLMVVNYEKEIEK